MKPAATTVPAATQMNPTSSTMRKVPTVRTRSAVFGIPSWLIAERIIAKMYLVDVIRKDSWLSQNRSTDLCGRK